MVYLNNLTHQNLVSALAAGGRVFSKAQWRAFGICDLRMKHAVRIFEFGKDQTIIFQPVHVASVGANAILRSAA